MPNADQKFKLRHYRAMTELEWVEHDIANLHGRIRLATRTLSDPKLPAVRRGRVDDVLVSAWPISRDG